MSPARPGGGETRGLQSVRPMSGGQRMSLGNRTSFKEHGSHRSMIPLMDDGREPVLPYLTSFQG